MKKTLFIFAAALICVVVALPTVFAQSKYKEAPILADMVKAG
jgi:hypothetical protein